MRARGLLNIRRPAAMAKDRSLEDTNMKKVSLIAGVTALAAIAGVLWSIPAAADMCGMAPCARAAHDKWPSNRAATSKSDNDSDDSATATGMPEPGTLALLALGFGGLGLSALRRKRDKS
jgi:hypothetical protein